MHALLDADKSSTNSTGKVIVLALLVTTPFFAPHSNPVINSYPHSYFNAESMRVVIDSVDSTGSVELFGNEIASFHKLSLFVKEFMQEQTITPPEFNKFFEENFWDLLA